MSAETPPYSHSTWSYEEVELLLQRAFVVYAMFIREYDASQDIRRTLTAYEERINRAIAAECGVTEARELRHRDPKRRLNGDVAAAVSDLRTWLHSDGLKDVFWNL